MTINLNDNLSGQAVTIKNKAQELIKTHNNIDSLKQYIEKTVQDNSKDYSQNLSLVAAASAAVLGLDPRVEQIQAALALKNSCIVEQDTGEGKTLVTALVACSSALLGDGPIHVVTSSEYLSRRDFNLMQSLFDFLEIKSSNPSSLDSIEKRIELCKNNTIIYSTIPALIHDLMHHQYYRFSEDYIDRGTLLVDEADLSLLDQAIAPFSMHNTKKFNVENFYKTLLTLKKSIEISDVSVDKLNKTCILNYEGLSKIKNIYDNSVNIDGVALDIFLRSFFLMTYEEDYTIENNIVYFITKNNNGAVKKSQLSLGYDLALTLKHNLSLKNIQSYPTSVVNNKMTFMEFTKYYPKVKGLTATGVVHAREFKEFYNLNVIAVPRSFQLDREMRQPLLFFNNKERNKDIARIIRENEGAAHIVACISNEQASEVSGFLQEESINHTLIDFKENNENEFIDTSLGSQGHVTVVTPSFSRGIDIVPDDEVSYMNLILVGPMPTPKIDYQMKGRVARQGRKGVVHTLISTEDSGVEFNINVKNNPGATKITKLFTKQIKRNQEIMAEAEFLSRKGLSERTELLENGRLMWLECKEQISKSVSIKEFLEKMQNLFGDIPSKERIEKEVADFTQSQQVSALPQIKSLIGTSFNRAWVMFLQEMESFTDLDVMSRISGIDYNTYYTKIEKSAVVNLRTNLYKESIQVLDSLRFN